MKHLKLSLVLSLTANFIFSQSGKLTGTVSEVDSVIQIPGVIVSLEGTDHAAMTDASGFYNLTDVPYGDYQLTTKVYGYKTISKHVRIDQPIVKIDLILKELVTELPSITIISGGRSGVRENSGAVHYISSKELDRFNYTDVNRVLRNIPGINIQEEDGFGLRPNIGMRGTGVERSSKITIMEDGVLSAPAPYAASAAYYFPTIGRMQGIEVIKGSSQIQHGPYTTGGAINLISTQIPDEFGGRISLMGGSFFNRNLHVNVGNKHKNISYLVETFQYGSDGFKKLDNGGNTGFKKEDYLAKIRVNSNPESKFYQSLTFKVGMARETSDETYLGLTESDFQQTPYRRYAASQMDQMNTEHSQLSLSHHIFLGENLTLSTTGYRNDFSRNWYKLDKIEDSTGNKHKISTVLSSPDNSGNAYDILTGNTSTEGALTSKANNRSYYSQGIQTRLNYKFKTGALKHDIVTGVRLHQDQIDRFQWVDRYTMDQKVMKLTSKGQPGTESNRVATANAISTFLQYRLKVNRFTFTPGLRYENIDLNQVDYGKNDPERKGEDMSERSNHVDAFIPGIGVNFDWNENFQLFSGIHRGFAPPGSTPETKPESSINYELGTRYNKKSIELQAVAFYNDYFNLLGSDLAASGGLGSGDLFNAGRAKTYGVEFFAIYDLLQNVEKNVALSVPLNVSYTYTNAVFLSSFESGLWGDVNEQDQLPYITPHQFSVMLSLEHKKFSFNISGRYNGVMRTEPGTGAVDSEHKIDSYFILDAGANYNVNKTIKLFTSVTNLTNQKYLVSRRPAGLRPGMPLSIMVGITSNF